jgi:hypothetical protein
MAHPKNKMSDESKALVSTLNSNDRKKPKVKAAPKKRKVPESDDSVQARAASRALVNNLNDDRTKHAKQRTFK